MKRESRSSKSRNSSSTKMTVFELTARRNEPTREELAIALGISERRLNQYVNLLRKTAPAEFQYFPGQRTFTPAQSRQLEAVREMFVDKKIESQVEHIIRTRGIPA